MSTKTIPLTILTGFLGAGKTSLIQRLMKNSPTKQFALIENEYAQTNIDAQLLAQTEAWIEQTSGCLCCMVEGDLWPVLKKLLSTAPRPIDQLIIETTGLADPTPLVSALLSQGPHREHIRLDGVITLIDALHFSNQKTLKGGSLPEEMMGQILQASVLGLTKTEDISSKEIEKLTLLLKDFNPEATVHDLSFSQELPDTLLDLKSFDLQKLEPTLIKSIQARKLRSSPKLSLTRAHHKPAHNHLKVSSHYIEHQGHLDPRVFELFLNITLSKGGGQLLRAKGILAFKDQPMKVLFQGVYDKFEFDLGEAWGEQEPINQIVLIGDDDMIELWERGLSNCLRPMTL